MLAAGAARAETQGVSPTKMLSEILDYIADKLAASEVGARLEMGGKASARAVGDTIMLRPPKVQSPSRPTLLHGAR